MDGDTTTDITMEHAIADAAFCKAMTIEDLKRFDVIHDAVVVLYESQDYDGINRLMELCHGTKNRGGSVRC